MREIPVAAHWSMVLDMSAEVERVVVWKLTGPTAVVFLFALVIVDRINS
jgi:hypothetical protein